MTRLASKTSLSASQRRFVETLQTLNLGRIEGLRIEAGEPVLEPPPTVVKAIKLGGENGPRPELHQADFILKSSFIELFQHFRRIGNGTVRVLEVKHGLPFMFAIEQ